MQEETEWARVERRVPGSIRMSAFMLYEENDGDAKKRTGSAVLFPACPSLAWLCYAIHLHIHAGIFH